METVKRKRIVGELKPTNIPLNHKALINAVKPYNYGSVEFIPDTNSIIRIDATSLTSSEVTEPKELYLFIGMLAQLIREEGIDELALKGTIEYTVEDSVTGLLETTHITVKHGTVMFQE
jgi:hypothetical protein